MTAKQEQNLSNMRLDKWLWCARFYKTRNLANEAIKTGKVKVRNEKIKSSKMIKCGETLIIKRGPYTHEITIKDLAKNRKSASEAEKLYEETEASLKTRTELAQQIKLSVQSLPHTKGRPTKRKRREIIRFTRRPDSS